MRKNFTKKSKSVLIIALVVLVMVVLFLIYWKATEYDRYRKKEMNSIEKNVTRYIETNEESSSYTFTYFRPNKHDELSMRLAQDEEFHEFVSVQAKRIVEQKPKLLWNFVRDFNFYYVDDVVTEAVVDAYENLCDLSTISVARDSIKLLMKTDFLFSTEQRKRIAYAHNKDSKTISSYIKENGMEAISTKPGEGYYADKTNSHHYNVVGLDNSPLYNSSDAKYFGDFMCRHSSGVRLNEYYEETNYADQRCYFRGEELSCCPSEGECVVSGEYLFVFAKDGRILGLHKFD